MNEPSRRQILAAFPSLLAVRAAFEERLSGQDPRGAAMRLPTRAEYLLDDGVTYLNHASVGTIPRLVHEAHVGYLAACESNPWLHVWGGAWSDGLERAHRLAAGVMGTGEDSVALIRNATAAFGMAANGLPFDEGDEVLYGSLNHVGASASWQDAAKARGFTVRRFEFPIHDVASLSRDDVTAAYVDAIQDSTRALILPHVDNVFGLRHDVKEIARKARERGVQWILVDAAQSVGMHPVRFDELRVDVYATSAHKWLQAPKGTGIMALSARALREMRPMVTSWGQKSWEGSARMFTDFGTRDLARILTLGDAIELHKRTSEGREARLSSLRDHLKERVDASPKHEWRSPAAYETEGASLVAVGLREGSAKALARSLFEEHGVIVRGFEGDGLNHIRVSPNVMNTVEEIDGLCRVLGC
ncbi:MAG: aminotransferase class V-fold PLP-dependent enzyme [Planctomycetota bacterium]